MILTIVQYIEALDNPEGRFRTLGRVYPVVDYDGRPLFSVPGHGLADFEIMAGGVRTIIRCPLRAGAEAESKLRAFAEKDRGLDSRFFTVWELREKEIVLFDASGRPVEQDVLVRPAAEGMVTEKFLRQAAAEGDTSIIMSALAELAELAEWSRNVRREISVRKLLFTPRGRVNVTGFSATGELDAAALAFFFTAAMPAKFADAGLPLLTHAATEPLTERLCVEAAAAGFPEPRQILAGDVAGPLRRLALYGPERIAALGKCLERVVMQDDPESVSEQSQGYERDGDVGSVCVKDVGGWDYAAVNGGSETVGTALLSAVVFREGRAEVETPDGKGLIDREGRYILEPIYEEVAWDDYWGLAAVMSEGRWSLLDRQGTLLSENHYDWLGECSEGFVLAQKDGRCGFLDAQGRETIPFVYDDATSFREGVSFVMRGGESFFIDAKGVRMPYENFDAPKSHEKGR